MPRAARKQFSCAKYHVMNRGNGGQRIFYTEDDYARFLRQLFYAVETDEVVLYAYCLMPNHFHLFVETPKANLDRFMARLCTAYAMYFRHKHARPGHCFQGRYKAPLVEGDDYALRLTRYIHLNPVKTRAARRLDSDAKLRLLRTHRWSSLGGYVSVRDAIEHVDYRWLGLVGGSRRRRYDRYIRQFLDEDDGVLQEAIAASPYAIGDACFQEEVTAWVRAKAGELPVETDMLVPSGERVSFEAIAAAVAVEFGIRKADLLRPRSRTGHARGVLAELACTLGGLTQRNLATYLRGFSEHAVGKSRRRLHDALPDDPALAQQIKKLGDALKSKV